jgi:large subunit ribosomal protein L18
VIKKVDKNKMRLIRHLRVRKNIAGTPEKPRLSVFRSEKHIYAQIIDDTKANTLVSYSSLCPDFKGANLKTWGKTAAKEVGKVLGKKALDAGITQVVFDRGGFKFHGRIKELADGAREAGLKF